jgi:hypothetical protein
MHPWLLSLTKSVLCLRDLSPFAIEVKQMASNVGATLGSALPPDVRRWLCPADTRLLLGCALGKAKLDRDLRSIKLR